MPRAKVIVSAGVNCNLNGRPFGRVKTFQFNSDTPRKAQYGLDSTEPYELQTTTTRCTGRIVLYRTVGDGGAEGAAITSRYEELLKEKYFTLQLVERASNTVIFEAQFCSVNRQSWTLPEKGIVTGDIEFEALDWGNELRPIRA